MISLFLAFTVTAVAQEYPIGAAIPADCGGFLVDSGLSSSDYGPNENLTSTLCQDGTDENLMTLYFGFCELGTGDQLTFYDGSSTSAPSLGTFGGNEIQGLDITSTNPDGCLTVVFTSNEDADVGSFVAQISCHTPCDRPFAIIHSDETEEDPIKVCVGEAITFDGAASTFADGMTLASWTWDFADGTTDNSSWPNVSHSFSVPGAYVVQLHLTDNNECSSGNLPDKLIYVSTTPDIAFTADDYLVCVGQEVDLTASATPVTWSALPTANFGGALFIPDDQTMCFADTLTFGGFTPGASITTESDLDFFFINFEHSFMGDFFITFFCPNGQTIAVHQQGGGGTWLGEPVDDDGDLSPGVGYDYYWAPDATGGTWADNAGGTLPAGTYESIQPFSNLIGCPLNGEWIIEICDAWASDNGYIFDWSVHFADYLYPDLISFTPSIGAGPDSTFITGPFIAALDANADNGVTIPAEAGTFTYTYTAIDDFGCTYTEDIEIDAYPGPIPFAGEDFNFCGPEAQLHGVITNPAPGINYNYSWTPGPPLTNPNIADPYIEANAVDTTSAFILHVNPSDDNGCIVSDTLYAIVPALPPSGPIDSVEFCEGSGNILIAPVTYGPYTYVWYYAPFGETDYIEVETNTTGLYSLSESGLYYVEIHEPVCDFTAETPFYAQVKPCQFLIPNIFTPNGSGGNDTFEIKGIEDFPNSTLSIYNRWGNLVYENENYKNTWTGEDSADGTYFYVVGIKTPDGVKYYEGHVTMLRK